MRLRRTCPLGLLLLLATLVSACGDEGTAAPDGGVPDGGSSADPSAALFPEDRILEIEITLDAADWEVLRNQPDRLGMPKITCGYRPTEKPYDYFPGEITIDGITVSNVGVRKRGNFGSISSERPALKIKANEYLPEQRIAGLRRVTLSNNHQDPTQISQCLGYRLFRAAGVAASRCSLAHVTVNGEDLGLYSNVESIKQEFLRRHFFDASGNLYENGGDFVPGGTDGFQPKVDREDPDCSDLETIVDALQATDAELVDQLGAVIDLDSFITFWAMEVITDHWDGYANNRNNHFFYHDPLSERFHWIPWGMDSLFAGRTRTTRPKSVFACGTIPWRLYDVPETRALYLDRLRELLDTVWDEAEILATIDRMETLLTPAVDPDGTGDLAAEIDKVRTFVSTRRDELLAELAGGDPVWPYPAGDQSCRINLGSLTASFDTSWGTLGTYPSGTVEMSGTVAGVDLTSSSGFSAAGLSDESQRLVQLFAQLANGEYAVVMVVFQTPESFTPGTKLLDLVNITAIMVFYDPETDSTYGGGLMLGGSVTLTAAEATAEAPVVGTVSGAVFEL